MKKLSVIIIFILVSVIQGKAGDYVLDEEGNVAGESESFAQEYIVLSDLLAKVNNSESAIQYKFKISQEIARLKSTQISGEEEYRALSAEEKRAFVKKFQNNNRHCSAVTQVMNERRRILLNPQLNKILGATIKDIP